MQRILLITVLVHSIGSLLFAQQDSQAALIRKATSHYYMNHSTKVSDSMFITTTYYDPNSIRFKEEETHYVHGVKTRSYDATFLSEDQLLEMHENGKLVVKNEYDEHGTILKSMALIDYGRDTLRILNIPRYRDGKLSEMTSVQMTKLGKIENVTIYTYQHFPDSNLVISTTKGGLSSLTVTECHDIRGKFLYTISSLKITGEREQVTTLEHLYDTLANLVEIRRSSNGKTVSSEKFEYQYGALVSSWQENDGLIIKTTYEFIKP